MKDLITDILQYIEDNEDVRERFEDIYYSLNQIEYEKLDYAMELEEHEKQIILIHALSSPNGKPICGFLYKEIKFCYNTKDENSTAVQSEISENYKIKLKLKIINHAKTLRTIYLDALDRGETHDEAYKLINDKYNEIF